MNKKNKVELHISQNIPSYVNSAGNTVEAFTNKTSFSSETSQEMTAENIAAFMLLNLRQYMQIRRLQGDTGFKVSKPLVIDITINGHKKATIDRLKFTLNPERLAKKLETAPELVAAVFTTVPNVGGLTVSKAKAFVEQGGKMVLATAVKKLENAGIKPVTVTDSTPAEKENAVKGELIEIPTAE